MVGKGFSGVDEHGIPIRTAADAQGITDRELHSLRALVGRLVEDDPWLPDQRTDERVWCWFCNGENHEHDTTCPWVEARALIGK